VKRHGAAGRNTARSRRAICLAQLAPIAIDEAIREGDLIAAALRVIHLPHLIRARDKASAATRPKQLGVPNVVTIGEDDFRDRLHYVKARPVVFCGCRWINGHRASLDA
jgi:hypothetical protein